MRKCPKCGAEYADTDFRTLCGYCMGNLAAAPANTREASATGPIAISEQSSSPIPITMTMPEITIPHFAMPEITLSTMPSIDTEVPMDAPLEPEAPAPQPGPIPPPLTPQPNPNIPQPPFIPLPEPEIEPDPAVPAPTPAPSPFPRPYPQPAPEPAPQPDEPSPVARLVQRDAIPAADMQKSNATALTSGVFSALCAVGMLIMLVLTHFDLFGLIIAGLLGYTAYRMANRALYSGAIHSIRIKTPGKAKLGGTLAMEIQIGAVRDLTVNAVSVTVTGMERAVRGNGNTRAEYKRVFFAHTSRLETPGQWLGGYYYTGTALVAIPADMPPSFTGRQNNLEWSATVVAQVNGAPKISESALVPVLPMRAKAIPLPESHPLFNLPQLGSLHAKIGFTCPVTEGNVPVFPVGGSVSFRLSLHPQGDFQQQQVWVELGYIIGGAGERESLLIAQHPYNIEYWKADPNRVEEDILTIPTSAPITYDGPLVRIHWTITVRHAMPWGQERRQVFEVKVVPGS